MSPQDGILRRALVNAAMLLGGKTGAGIMQLATFAIAARGLGLVDFGNFSVLVAQVMLITGLAAFDTNQAIIRYGLAPIEKGDVRRFQNLVKAGTLLDLGAALLAAIATVLLAPLLGRAMEWDDRLVGLAQLMAPLAFTNALATPKGMLRAFGRFDLLTWHVMAAPLARLAGVSLAWALEAPLVAYCLVWLVAGWIGAIVVLCLGWSEAGKRGLLTGMTLRFHPRRDAEKGMWRFTLLTDLNSSVALVPSQLSVVIVGAVLGPGAAGLTRAAREICVGIMKPVDLVNQALFPDIARLVAGGEWARLKRSAMRAGLAAGAIGLLIAAFVHFWGEPLLGLVFGTDFTAASGILLAMVMAVAIRVFVFPSEPILMAMGQAGIVLATGIATATLFVALLWWRLPAEGIAAVGLSFLAMNIVAGLISASVAMTQIVRYDR